MTPFDFSDEARAAAWEKVDQLEAEVEQLTAERDELRQRLEDALDLLVNINDLSVLPVDMLSRIAVELAKNGIIAAEDDDPDRYEGPTLGKYGNF